MKRMIVVASIVFSVSALFAIPQTIQYQGKLTDMTGVGENDSLDMTFHIYDVETGGAALWSEIHASSNKVRVVLGLFDVELGSITPIDLPFDEQYWLEIDVDGNTLTPRMPLTTSPYAFRAAVADSFTGGVAPWTQDTMVAHWDSLRGVPDFDDGDWTISGSNVYRSSGNVGIGTSTPFDKLHVAGGNILLNNYWVMGWGNTSNAVHGSSIDNYLRFRTNYLDRVIINSEGNMGIGEMSPVAKLDLEGGTGVGLKVENSGTDGIYILNPVSDGLQINAAGAHGIRLESPVNDGVFITTPGGDGIEIKGGTGTQRGIYIHDNSGLGDPDTGIVIRNTGETGIVIDHPDLHGMEIKYANWVGLRIISPADDGIYIYDTELGDGIRIEDAGMNGIFIDSPDCDGVRVENPGDGTAGYNCFRCYGELRHLFRVSSEADIYGHTRYSYITDDEGVGIQAPLSATTNCWLEHVGEASLSGGECRVDLPNDFLDGVAINSKMRIQVFITPYAFLGDYWIERGDDYFVVHRREGGGPDAAFAYRVLGRIKGSENIGIEHVDLKEEMDEDDARENRR